jgi:hypothetical protein
MIQFLVPAIHLKRIVTEARRISEELFTNFSYLTVITLSETRTPYSCLFPLECAKNFGSHSIHSHTSHKRDDLVRPDQLCVVFALKMGVQAVWGKDLHQLFWGGSRAAYGKITVCRIINR